MCNGDFAKPIPWISRKQASFRAGADPRAIAWHTEKAGAQPKNAGFDSAEFQLLRDLEDDTAAQITFIAIRPCASMVSLVRGSKVKVREFGGGVIERRVVADKGAKVVICNEKEYQAAKEQGREPEGIGFPRDAIGGRV